MTLTPSGDFLFCLRGSPILHVIKSATDEVKETTFTVSPLQPIGVHVTRDSRVIIGAVETGSYLPATGPRQVIVMDQSGYQQQVFEYDKDKQPLFTAPARVTSNSYNIGVIDVLSKDGLGQVIIIDYDGVVRNVFKGQADVNKHDSPLIPNDIVSTQSGNFVISDSRNHTMHVLSNEGEIVTYYNTLRMGIAIPFSVSLGHTGELYIGCGTSKVKGEKAKVFKIDNFVW